MHKTLRFLLPLLLLCTLLITMTALPTFAAEERFESTSDEASETIIDNATDTAIRIEYESSGYYMEFAGITVYNASMLVELPFAAELTLAIVAGVIAAWTLLYILWVFNIIPNGKGFDRVMEPCGKYFDRPLTDGICATCKKLTANTNKLESFFYWTVLGLGTVHILSRLVLNLMFGSFSFGAQLLIPLFALLLIFLVMGNCSILSFRFGNLLPAVCSAGVLTYLGFQLYASFTVGYELTLMIWIARVAMMALALFFLGVLVNQWVPEIVGATVMQAGGALFLIFAGARFLVNLYTVPGTFFTDLFLISLVPLFYFVYRDLRLVRAKKVVDTESAEEAPADGDVSEFDTAPYGEETVVLAEEAPIVTEDTPTEA